MSTSSSTERLAQVFERELRRFEPVPNADRPAQRAVERVSVSVSAELEALIADFAMRTRSNGATPEHMLVELKKVLATVAPEVPGSRRNALVSQITGRAIEAFFGR